MDFHQYQEQALKTDQVPTKNEHGIIVPLLGLAGEAGSLLTEYKKHLRDGDAHKLFKETIADTENYQKYEFALRSCSVFAGRLGGGYYYGLRSLATGGKISRRNSCC